MGSFSIWHWIVVLAIVLLLFGTGRVSNLMGDLAKGVKAFKKGLQDDEGDQKAAGDQPKVLTADSAKPATTVEKDEAVKH
ncbi:MAG TPA: twin-arginine translocase TatA/TatE family subunit [Telmatospirillum sp.]|nr:twin-arginine translocase TatA/TatE family subunit [Telmatospirillum sp.]